MTIPNDEVKYILNEWAVKNHLNAWAGTFEKQGCYLYKTNSRNECYQILVRVLSDAEIAVHLFSIERWEKPSVDFSWNVASENLTEILDLALDKLEHHED